MVRPYLNTSSAALDRRNQRLKADIFNTCHSVVTEKIENSKVINASTVSQSKIPRFDRHEIVEGKTVGRGGFAVIREITSFELDRDAARRPSGGSSRSERTASTGASTNSDTSPERRALAKESSFKASKKGSKYVLKELDRSNGLSAKNQNAYMNGVVDMAMEAQYLANLSHPHILTLKGISTSNQFGGDDGMFLVLEYLPETLSKRLNVWMQKDRAMRGVTGFVTGSRKKAGKLLLTRIRVARDVADAMNYLHSKDIIFRDVSYPL